MKREIIDKHWYAAAQGQTELAKSFAEIYGEIIELLPVEARTMYGMRLAGCQTQADIDTLLNGTLGALFLKDQPLAKYNFELLELARHVIKTGRQSLSKEEFARLALLLKLE